MQLVIDSLKKGMEGDVVANLHEVLFALIEKGVLEFSTSASDRNVLRALKEDQVEKSYRIGTIKTIHKFQDQQQLPSTGEVGNRTADLLNDYLRKFGFLTSSPKFVFTVEGKVVSRSRPGVGKLTVLIMDKNAGPDEQLAKISTDADGVFEATFTYRSSSSRKKTQPDLQAMAYAGSKLVGSSAVRYHASNHETLNVILESEQEAQLESEYDTLTQALTAQVERPLRELKEDAERTDITFLANKTGWDARAVALAALADEFSEASGTGTAPTKIPSALYYSLFRAGVPANEAGLYQTDVTTVKGIWEQGMKQGIVPKMGSAALAQELKRFQTMATQQALKSPAILGLSSLKEMLSVSLGSDAAKQQQFTELHLQFRDDPVKLWNTVKTKMGAAVETRLRVDGQLAVLTMNNAPLIKKLHQHIGQTRLNDPKLLVRHGYYRAQDWKARLGNGPVPPEIPGATLPEKRQRYAEVLAEKIRLSFPTGVIGQMVKTSELRLRDASLKGKVHQFLATHEEAFSIDLQPVEQFLRLKQVSLDTLDPEMLEEVKRIQRVKQLAPNDLMMRSLLKANLDSAASIVRYSPEQFQNVFAPYFVDEDGLLTQSLYRKAEQVHLTMVHTAVSFLWARTAPTIGQSGGIGEGMDAPGSGVFIHPTPHVPDEEQGKSVIAYPTLESLFGELDYCACEHCRSILSPAAYLVNLLQFLEYSPDAWQVFRNKWGIDHHGAGYPFLDRAAWERAGMPEQKKSPLDILLSRRPDLEHLPLTCENTNIPLPYIDVVNETLEQYVAHIENAEPLNGYHGHSTPEDVTSEELLAAPHFIQDAAYKIVQDAAYKTLAEASFPLRLPFHQPLEYLRRSFTRFDLTLSDVMEVLREDEREVREGESDYGWTEILMEEIGISRQAFNVVTNKDWKFKLSQLYGFPEGQGDAAVKGQLVKAKDFSRRVGISYADVVAILKTRFINPQAVLLSKLERLGVPIVVLTQLKERDLTNQQFLALLPKDIDTAPYDGNIPKWVKDHYAKIMTLILLTDPRQSQGDAIDHCSFDQFEFLHADGRQLTTVEWYKFIHLLRLKHLLGWTYEQVDQAISALVPELSTASSRKALSDGFTLLVPRIGVLLRLIRRLGLNVQNDLPALLACFASIETYGSSALYRQMFLSSSLTDHDEAFADNGSGEFLTDDGQKLLAHEGTLRAALSLTSDEFTAIVKFLEFTPATGLTVENVSAVFRHGWLAKQLRISVVEFLKVMTRTGLNPFDLSNPSNPPILQLIQFFSRLRTTGLLPAEALYLLWHEDLNESSTPSNQEILGLMRTVRTDLVAIEQEFIVLDDPDGQKTREKMALVYGTDDTNQFFRILETQIVLDVPYEHYQDTLAEQILDAGDQTISYDNFAKRLRYTGGVMTKAQWKALNEVDSFTGIRKFKTAIDELYRQSRQVFDDHPELEEAATTYQDSQGTVGEKQAAVLKALLPDLVRRRKQQQTIQILSGATKVDAEFSTQLLQAVMEGQTSETDTLFVLHATDNASQAAIHDLTAIEEQGLSGQFYFKESIAVGDTPAQIFESGVGLSFAGATGSKSLPRHTTPGKPISGQWDGWIEGSQAGPIQFRIMTDAGATVRFRLNNEEIPLKGDADQAVWTPEFPVDLQGGRLYPISLKVEKVTERIQVRWKTPMGSWEDVPSRLLYAKARVEPFLAQYIRFMKVASLAKHLSLSAEELAYVGAQEDLRIEQQNWLNTLPASVLPTDSDRNATLFKGLQTVLNLARVKLSLRQQGSQLLQVLKDPDVQNEKGDVLLHSLMRWAPDSVAALLERFNQADRKALGHPSVFARVFDAMRACQQCGVSAAALIQATTNDPSPDVFRNFQSALRARYDHSRWLEVLKPIHDDLRRLRRDALVTYLLHRMHNQADKTHIDTPEKLFEFFLMDVQMDPCMQTSRIRHALSSIQLFIERCFMNLEPQVAPSALDAQQWEWMKRYRVWEANRKVFLYPENWLEPELRDNQSPFFKEMMSELLQSDITEDRAATALLGYLSKLDEVAKLEPCGLYVQEGKEESEEGIVHVVARTAGAGRKYFYRRRNPSGWTPWEQIHLDIEDNPVLPVVWNDRLFLFWLKILQQSPDDLGSSPKTSNSDESLATASYAAVEKAAQDSAKQSTKPSVQVMLCWSEYFNNQWSPTKTSDMQTLLSIGQFPMSGLGSFERAFLVLSSNEENGRLRIICEYKYDTQGISYSFIFENSHNAPRVDQRGLEAFRVQESYFGGKVRSLVNNSESNPLSFKYYVEYTGPETFSFKNNIFKYRRSSIHSPFVLASSGIQKDKWDTPFLYADSHHVFYVRTTESPLVFKFDEFSMMTFLFQNSDDQEAQPLVQRVDSDGAIARKLVELLGIASTGERLDSKAITQFITEDTYIKRGLVGLSTIDYKGIKITPSGGRP